VAGFGIAIGAREKSDIFTMSLKLSVGIIFDEFIPKGHLGQTHSIARAGWGNAKTVHNDKDKGRSVWFNFTGKSRHDTKN
jgi:hypothetical protein